MKTKSIVAIALTVALCGFATTADAKGWTGGYSQGENVYQTKTANGKNEVALYCSGDSDAQTFFLSGKAPGPIAAGAAEDNMKMTMQIDGHDYAVPFAAKSYKSQADYKAFWESFRNAKSITILAGGKEYKVPTEGLKAALPAYGSPEFDCGLTTN